MPDNHGAAATRRMISMPRVLAYLVLGYVVLALLVSLTTVGPAGLSSLALLAIVGGAVWVVRRRAATPQIQPQVRLAVQPPAREVEPASALLARRLEALSHELTEDPADSALMLDLMSLYENEPPEELARVQDRYREERKRLVACLRTVHGGDRPSALGRTVDELEAYVAEVRRTVESAGADAIAAALEVTGRAAAALGEARQAAGGVGGEVGEELAASLDAAAADLERAEGAFVKGAERPLLALRLAAEVERAAREAKRRAERIQALPGELGHRLREFDRAAERVDRDLRRIKEEFAASSQAGSGRTWSGSATRA